METSYKTTVLSLIVLAMIPNMVSSFHFPKPHLNIHLPFHIHIGKPHLHIHIPNYPKIIIEKICEKLGQRKDCIKHVKRPLCLDRIIGIPGCFKDIHNIAKHRRHGNLAVDCCNTILGVGANPCLSLLLPPIHDVIGLIMAESCTQVYKNTPPPPAVARPKQLAGSKPVHLPLAALPPSDNAAPPRAVSPTPTSD